MAAGDWTRGVFSVTPVRGQDDLLLVWVDGIRAKVAEDKSEAEVNFNLIFLFLDI